MNLFVGGMDFGLDLVTIQSKNHQRKSAAALWYGFGLGFACKDLIRANPFFWKIERNGYGSICA